MPELSFPLLWKPAMIQMVASLSIRILKCQQHWAETPADLWLTFRVSENKPLSQQVSDFFLASIASQN